MLVAAFAVLVIAALVVFGARPLLARPYARLVGLALAVAAAGGGVFEIARGGWISGALLLAAALWLATTLRRARPPPKADGMGRAEAASMLGVAETASREEVEAAFRRLIARVHPDHGGAAGLAAQINAARAVLLGAKR